MNWSFRSISALAIAAFVTGICFAAGRATIDWFHAEESIRIFFEKNKRFGIAPNPAGLAVHGVKLSPSMDGVEVSGTITNTGSHLWLEPTVRAVLFAGKSQIADCQSEQNYSITPSEIQSFRIVCDTIRGAELPPAITYQVSVSNAWFERPAAAPQQDGG